MKPIDHLTISQAIHTKTFWIAVVSAILSVLMALGLPISASQAKLIEGAIAIIVSMILGGSAVAYAHAKAASMLAVKESDHESH